MHPAEVMAFFLSRAGRILSRSVAGRASLLAVWKRNQFAAAQTPAPEVYTRPPPPPREKKPGQLEQWQVDQFFEQGFVLVPSFFTEEELQPVIAAVNECVDILANKLFNGGKIQDKCEGAGFYHRLMLLEQQFKGTAVLLHKMGYLPPGFRQLWGNERLLNVVEQFIGPDIAGHPVWNLRTKVPMNDQVTVPWHQDNGYFDPSALYTLLPTAWIPLLDTNMENGCMQVVARGHKPGVTAKHTCCAGDTWYVDLAEAEIERTLGVDIKQDVVTCEVPFGGALFFNNSIPHRSLENYSDKIRWSLDLRWQHPNKSTGFFGLKDSVVMRKSDDPNYRIDWEEFATVDRQKLQMKDEGNWDDPDDFDTTIHGPWMKRWEITNPNRHTDAAKAADSSWQSHRSSKP